MGTNESLQFDFVNREALGPQELITDFSDHHIRVRLYRKMRVEPLAGMKQPLLNSAIMGLETYLAVSIDGQLAKGYKWRLYQLIGNKTKFIQRGITDENGLSNDINIGFDPHQYRLLIYSPKVTR